MDFPSEEDPNVLQASIAALQNELEDKNQQIHHCKKELTLAEAMEADYQQEIEILQSSEKVSFKELQNTIKALEDDILHLTEKSNSDLSQKNDQIEDLCKEITKHSKDAVESNQKEASRDNSDAERNSHLKKEIDTLNDNTAEIHKAIDHWHTQNMTVEATRDRVRAAMNEAKQELENKSQELVTLKNLIYSLQEDSVIAKLELESAKNKPLDANRKGNSLFAEVEDSRMKIQQSLQQMKKTYREMRQDLDNRLRQLAVLRKHNIELSSQFNQPETCHEEFEETIQEHKIQMNILELKVEQYRQDILKEVTFTSKNLPSYAMDFINSTLKAKWADEENVRSTLNEESKKKLETCVEIQKTNSEKRKWRRKAQQLKVQVEKLESAISRRQSSDSFVEDDDIDDKEVVTKNEPAIELDSVDTRKRSIERRRNTIEVDAYTEVNVKPNCTRSTLPIIKEHASVSVSNSSIEHNINDHEGKDPTEKNQSVNLKTTEISQCSEQKSEIKILQKETQDQDDAINSKQHNLNALGVEFSQNRFLNMLKRESKTNSAAEIEANCQNNSINHNSCAKQFRVSALADEMQQFLSLKDNIRNNESEVGRENVIELKKEQQEVTNKFILNYVNCNAPLNPQDNVEMQDDNNDIQCNKTDNSKFEYLNAEENFKTEQSATNRFISNYLNTISEENDSFSDKENSVPYVDELLHNDQEDVIKNISKESVDLVISLDSDEDDDVVLVSSDPESTKSNDPSEAPTSWLSMFKTEMKSQTNNEQINKENVLVPYTACTPASIRNHVGSESSENATRRCFTQSEKISKIKLSVAPSSLSERKVLNKISNIPLPARRKLN